MKNKLLFSLLLAAGLLPNLASAETLVYRKPVNSPGVFKVDSATPVVSFDKGSLDFGTVTAGTSVTRSLVLSNTGKVALPSISPSFSPSGVFSIDGSSTCGVSLGAGESCILVVKASPTDANRLGNGGSITVGNAQAALNGFTFVPAPGSTVSLGTLNFGSQPVSTTSNAQSVTLNNTGNVALAVTDISASGPFASTHNCPASIPVNSSCTVNTVFSPVSPGVATGDLSITTGAGVKTVSLQGTGTQALAAVSPSVIDFGSIMGGTSTTSEVITYSSVGNIPLTNISINMPTRFAVVNSNCSDTLAAGSSCTFQVKFTPDGGDTYNTNLSITTGNAGYKEVGLKGHGIANTAADVSLGALNFADQLVGSTSSAKAVTLNNTGNVAVTVNSISTTGDFTATHNCSSYVPVGSYCTINTTFGPTTYGDRTGTLTISTAAGNKVVSLSGKGLQAVASLSTTSLAFGTKDVGTTTDSAAVTLTNNGNTSMTSLALQPPTGYSITASDCGTTLAANGSCSFQVRFSPTAPQSYNGDLTVSAAEITTQKIALTATAQAVDPLGTVASFTYNGIAGSPYLFNKGGQAQFANVGITHGKWYVEVPVPGSFDVGLTSTPSTMTGYAFFAEQGMPKAFGGYIHPGGYLCNWTYCGPNMTNVSVSNSAFTGTDTVGLAIDADNNKVGWYRNGTLIYTTTGVTLPKPWYFGISANAAVSMTVNFGQKPFTYGVPSGFVAGLGSKAQ